MIAQRKKCLYREVEIYRQTAQAVSDPCMREGEDTNKAKAQKRPLDLRMRSANEGSLYPADIVDKKNCSGAFVRLRHQYVYRKFYMYNQPDLLPYVSILLDAEHAVVWFGHCKAPLPSLHCIPPFFLLLQMRRNASHIRWCVDLWKDFFEWENRRKTDFTWK